MLVIVRLKPNPQACSTKKTGLSRFFLAMSQSVVAAVYSALLSFLSNSGSASRRLHFFVATKKAKQRKRPLLNRPAGTRLRRYEIQPEADRFGILPQLPISPSMARPCGPFSV
ncbi:MAG: hypothetical protein ACJAWL_003460 [Motiliproteus sp.]|jgi:hypothetical protein